VGAAAAAAAAPSPAVLAAAAAPLLTLPERLGLGPGLYLSMMAWGMVPGEPALKPAA
jgi:hypothetical protein